MEVAKNVFRSLSMDLNAVLVQNTHMIYNENFRVLTRENNNLVLNNIKGNKLVANLTPGYIPVSIEVYGGIAYIISAQTIYGQPTGKGEIGTFPSPDYDKSNQLVSAYAPLMNYFNTQTGNILGPMQSDRFAFTLEKAFSMVVEEDYDGTVNMVWTDGVNPMRIINSRFAVRENFTYEIVERVGVKETNVYRPEDFDTIINLVSKVSRIMKIDFNGVLSGGTLQSGNYRYYFRLETEDGNMSDVMGESGLVSVFHGNRPSDIRGGYVENTLQTDKMVSFDMENVDESYRFVRAFFVFSSGENEPIERSYMIDQRFPIENGIVRFNHLGSEQLIPMDISELNLDSQSIDTVGTITKAGDYILAGDVTEKVVDYQRLIDFSRNIAVSHTEKKIGTYGKTNNGGDLGTVNQQGSELVGTDGYNNGYANPKNIYHKTPYSSGEAYPFGIRFLLKGGGVTPTFPIMGVDNKVGNMTYPDPSLMESLASSLADIHQGFRETDGMNIKGVYRFPNKTTLFDGQNLNVYGLKFRVPNIPNDIKDITIGIQFMRGAPVHDRITQGVFFNTMPIPVDTYTEARTGTTRGWRLYDYLHDGVGYTENTAKWVPSYDFNLESPGVWELGGNGIERSNKTYDNGIVPIRFSNAGGRELNKDKMFAFVSPEIQALPSKTISKLNNRNVNIKLKGRVVSFMDAATKCYNNNSTYSLIRQKGLTPLNSEYPGKVSWVVSGQHGPNADRFAGGCYFQGHTGHKEFTMYNLVYNEYAGLTFDQAGILDLNMGQYAVTDRAGDVNYNKQGTDNDASVLADIYPENGQRTTAQLKRIYSNLNAVTYFPVSERLYWDELEETAIPELSLEAKLNIDREIEFFGGDDFPSPHYRRLYINAYGSYGQQNFSEFQGASSIGETMMYFAESKVNTAIRGEHTFDVSEYRMRSFYPYEAGKKPFVIGDKYGTGSPWREYRLPESQNYNHGHRQLLFGRHSIAFPTDSPYMATRRRARIMHSAKFTSNSFNNEFRIWEGLNYQDYDNSKGKIVRIGVIGDRVVIVQESGTSFIRLEERIAAGNDSAGPVYFESAGVLPPKASPISNLGSSWPESVVFTDMGVYGFDHASFYVWKYDYKQLVPVSKLSIDSYLHKHLQTFGQKTYKPYSDHNIVASRDAYNEEINFSFLNPQKAFTVGFSEVTQEFTSFYTFVPDKAFSNLRKYYTAKNGEIWEHDRNDVPRGNFYGNQHKFRVSFVVKEQSDMEKVFGLMDIHSNHVFPSKITFRVPGAKTEEIIVHNGPIYDVNAKYIGNKVAISIPKIAEVTNNDETEYGLAEMANQESLLSIGSRIRGNVMVVELEYDDLKSIQIKSVLNYFNYS